MVPESLAVTSACKAAFTLWRETLASELVISGVAANRAKQLATTILTMQEGCLVFSRAIQTIEPFQTAIETIDLLLDQKHASRSRS
jgi:TetR/AcrR family transcriptional repressor of lmrAB and yxaGH operons